MNLEKVLQDVATRRRLPPPERRREIRERAGVSQEVVARAVRVSRAAVSRWENGDRTPKAGSVSRRYLDVLETLSEARP